MNNIVLDSSAIIALLNEEPGWDLVAEIIAQASVNTVNMAEVYSKIAERGSDTFKAASLYLPAISGVVPFTDEMARIAGSLRPETRALGLSLGDRAWPGHRHRL